MSQRAVIQELSQTFGFNLLYNGSAEYLKTIAVQLYKDTYEEIFKKIVHGKLIHADETKISIEGKSAYIWVFTNLEEVAYLYTETREGDFLQELLRDFKGVLASDFYGLFAIIEADPKSFHNRLKYAFAYCVHFVDHTPSAGSA